MIALTPCDMKLHIPAPRENAAKGFHIYRPTGLAVSHSAVF